MRIIGGTARGRLIQVPPLKTTRPTSDRVRESLFGLLEVLDLAWDRVLDLYAGSGALGLEALSRGAGRADFVESRAAACATIRANLAQLDFQNRARVFCRPVERVLPSLTDRYDIILADPPYADAARDTVLGLIATTDRLADAGVLILEHSRHHPLAETWGTLHLTRQRRHGDTVISIFQQGDQR